MNHLENIRLAIEKSAECPAEHRETVPVVETFRGQTVWEGAVEVFRLASPPPEIAYGWAVPSTDGQPQYVTVLGKPPIQTALDAVRAWIVSTGGK